MPATRHGSRTSATFRVPRQTFPSQMSRYGLWRTLYTITCRRNARTNVKRVVVLPPHETLDVKLTGLRVEGWAVDLNAAHASEKRRAGAILDHRGTALATSSVKDTKAMSIHVAQTSPCRSIVNSEEWNMISNFTKKIKELHKSIWRAPPERPQ